MKALHIIRIIICLAAGTLCFVIPDVIVEIVPFFVGGVMLFYSAEGLTECLHEHKSIENVRFFDDLILILLALVMMFAGRENYSTACIIWAVWSILREGLEIEEIYHHRKIYATAIASCIESLVVIVMSIMLILEPTEHHAFPHVLLLGVELFTHSLFPIIHTLASKKAGKSSH